MTAISGNLDDKPDIYYVELYPNGTEPLIGELRGGLPNPADNLIVVYDVRKRDDPDQLLNRDAECFIFPIARFLRIEVRTVRDQSATPLLLPFRE